MAAADCNVPPPVQEMRLTRPRGSNYAPRVNSARCASANVARPRWAWRFRKRIGFATGAFVFSLLLSSGCKHILKTAEKAPPAWPAAIGRVAENRYLTPTGQLLTPAGTQVELPGMRPQMLALSPDGKLLVTAGKSGVLVAIDPATGRILQKSSLSTNKPASKLEPKAKDVTGRPRARKPAATPETVETSFNGLTFAPDGKRVYFTTASGTVRAIAVAEGKLEGLPLVFRLPKVKTKNEIPTGLAISSDGKKIYVAGNVANKLYELDAASGRTLRSWDTGVAPFDIVLAAGKAYVSNLGGPRPAKGDVTAPAGRSTVVGVDPVRFIPNKGSLTVIDLAAGGVKAEVAVELHPSALAVSPNRKYVVVANTGSDTLSVISTKTDAVVEKIWARQTPGDLFGAQPNALAFDRTGRRLFVCNGTQNALAIVQFEPEDNASKVIGLLPAGWFPGAVVFDANRKNLCIANIKGLGALKLFKPGEAVKLTSKDFFGTVSLVPFPSARELAAFTELALRNMRYPRLAEARLPARPGQPARPVPERMGEPSVFKHVLYVIKENRTYDQILGDMPEGNGNTNLCTFGETYTPNQHKIAREFVLLDNTYCSGVQSADGHQWTDSAMANAYIERQLTAGYPRSYPGAKSEDAIDALAWASSGFIWDNALAHGKSFRNYGEWMMTEAGWADKSKHKTNAVWRDFWQDYQAGTGVTRLKSKPGIESLRKHSKLDTVGWDLRVPDVMRAAEFIKELRAFETNGTLPELTILFLPNDHTGGAKESYPTPGAQIADNDLALGHVVEALSHSKFWAETCLFVIEDDPQAGWDHVSGYRTTCYVVSPYTKRNQTVSTHYNQVSLVRTMELILGLPPMNQLDAVATPMSDCFTDVADLTPFTSVPNRFPLDQINPPAKKVADAILRKDALVSQKLPLDEMDKCPEDLFNRILWRAMKGPRAPYPEWAVKMLADEDD